LHRDVEVRLPGRGWRSIERVRETRGFELWDHDGSLPLDPAAAAEPLVAIPHVWRGTTAELTAPDYRASLDRLLPAGSNPLPARSTTRVVSTVDRLLVLAELRRENGRLTLAPPPGGYVISALELPDAMRLLGAPRRRLLLAGAGMVAAGMLLGLVALVLALLTGLA
ncbi:MAG TPA: hypothetical protein VHK28_07735, partial [Candidatus Limnocylindria bacterium]|nr:hypothetical protein [Candidatus Limnocylindria bacterium]